MPKVQIQGFKCTRCEWEWVPIRENKRKGKAPEVCPSCKSPYWDKPRRGEEMTMMKD